MFANKNMATGKIDSMRYQSRYVAARDTLPEERVIELDSNGNEI